MKRLPGPDDEIEAGYQALTETVRAHCPDGDLLLLRKAFEIAERCHSGQRRRSGHPYILHPLIVADYVAQWRQPLDCVLAALLHDLPHAGWDIRSFRYQLPAGVIALVEGVCALDRFTNPTAMMHSPDPDRRRFAEQVLTVSIADRLHNAQTWQYVPRAHARRSARQTIDLVAPIAGTLHLPGVGSQLCHLATTMLAQPEDAPGQQTDAPPTPSNRDRITRTSLTNTLYQHAVRLLPSQDRERYADEWAADLAVLTPRERLSFAVGLLYSAQALRRLATRRARRI